MPPECRTFYGWIYIIEANQLISDISYHIKNNKLIEDSLTWLNNKLKLIDKNTIENGYTGIIYAISKISD